MLLTKYINRRDETKFTLPFGKESKLWLQRLEKATLLIVALAPLLIGFPVTGMILNRRITVHIKGVSLSIFV